MSTTLSTNNSSQTQENSFCTKRLMSYFKYFFQRLFSRKPMGEINVAIAVQNELRRTLSWYQLIAIGLGCTIGAGIFSLSGHAAAKHAGPSVIVSFIITGVMAFLSALSFSELGAMMSISGAAYTYTFAAMGEYLAWFIGWNYALLYQLAALMVVVSWSKYVVHFIDLISDYNVTSKVVQAPVLWDENTEQFIFTGQVLNIPAIVVTLVITVILVSGIRQTAMINLVLVIIKIIILLIFIFVCSKYVDRKNFNSFIPENRGSFSEYGTTGMLQACTYVFFAHVGFDSVATVAQEARTPTRAIPIATIASVIVSTLIYVGICTVMVGLVPYTLLNTDSPLTDAIQQTPYGLWLQIFMVIGAILSLFTVALIVLLSQTRIFYAMAKDGLLPEIFSKVHPRTNTPWISTIISGVFCAIIAGVCPVDIVGETTAISALITYIFVHITVIIMRFTHTGVQRTFRVPCGKWLIPTVGSLLCILLMKGISKETFYRFLVWTAIGQIIYFSYGFWHSKRRQLYKIESVGNMKDTLPTVESIYMDYQKKDFDITSISESVEHSDRENDAN